jgi:DNA/RNA endonuclease YhcR with UshA esterase domain
MIRFSRHIAFLSICYAILFDAAQAQTTTVIPANLAASHIGEYATVEGVVAKAFTSKNGNTFLNIGASYPNQTFTGWMPNSSPVKDSALLDRIEGKQVKITGRIELYKGKPEIRINAAEQLEVE